MAASKSSFCSFNAPEPPRKIEIFRFRLVTRVSFSNLLIERFASQADPALLLE